MKCKWSIPENFIGLNDSLQNFRHDFPTYWLLPLPRPTTWWLSRWPGSCRPGTGCRWRPPDYSRCWQSDSLDPSAFLGGRWPDSGQVCNKVGILKKSMSCPLKKNLTCSSVNISTDISKNLAVYKSKLKQTYKKFNFINKVNIQAFSIMKKL